MDERACAELAARLAGRPRVTVLTGAGVSAASGVPTFRGAGGLWRSFRAEDLATPSAFARDPALVWEWYDWRRQLVALCQPNRAHEVLAAWSRRLPDLQLVTQNVDGLHERAGTRRVLRFHGSLWELRCWQGCADAPASWRDETVPLATIPPRCPHCGGIARPGVVWFGETIDPRVLSEATRAAECELFLVVGTAAVVHPAAALVDLAREAGAFTVEVDPDATGVSRAVDLVLRGPAEEVLDAVEERLEGGAPPRGERA